MGARGPRRLEQLRLGFERLLLRGLPYRLALAALIVLTVAFVAGIAMRLLDPSFDNTGESVWWAFLRLTDPGYLGDDVGVVGRLVSTVVTVLGYILFLGLLIAILTQWMNETIARLESGVRPVVLKGHILILGWTHRTPNIVLGLLRTKGRTTRFLETHEAKALRIVVLAEKVDRELIEQLKERLDSLWNDRQVMLRSGSPLKLEHLGRVSFEDAATIILPGDDFSNRSPGVADADTLKTLLSIGQHTNADAASRPLAVAALYDANRSNIARMAYGGETEIVAVDQVVCRFIAQSVRQPGMWTVYSQLLSINVGNGLYLRRFRGSAGTPFGSLRHQYPRAVPIGFISSRSGKPILNPPPRTGLETDDLLVFTAERFADCEAPAASASVGEATATRTMPEPSPPSHRVLILGWCRKVASLLAEFSADDMTIDVVGLTPTEDRAETLRAWPDLKLDRVQQIEANFLDIRILADLQPWAYDRIIILARARMGTEAHADAATITAYMSLRHLLSQRTERPNIFVEVLEEENRFLFDSAQDDVLVSPLTISSLLSQIALRRELATIIAELSRLGGPQIVLAPLTAADHAEPTGFDALADVAEQRGTIALGLLRADGELLLNPDRASRWQIDDDDQLIVLTTAREPSDS